MTAEARGRQQTFLLRLSDALRSLASPADVQEAVARETLTFLEADRCFYAEVQGESVVIHRDAGTGDLQTVAGTYPVAGSRLSRETLRAGKPLVVPDVRTCATASGPVGQLRRHLQAVSLVAAPVVKQGQLVGLLVLTQNRPREWTELELELAAETAERTWGAAEQVKAKEALVRSEEQYRTLIHSMNEGYALIEVVDDAQGRVSDFVYLEVNAAAEQITGLRDITGRSVSEVASAEPVWLELFGQVAATGRPVQGEWFHQGLGRWFRIAASRPGGAGSREVAVFFSDVTERRQAEETLRHLNVLLEERVTQRTSRLDELNGELQARNRALEAFAHLTRDIGTQTDRNVLIRLGQEVALALLPEGFAAYYEPREGRWQLCSQVGDLRHSALAAAVKAGLPVGQSPSLDRPWADGRPLFQGADAAYEWGVGQGLQALAALPLTVNGSAVGIFTVALFEERTWSASVRAVLDTVTRSLGLALEHSAAIRTLAEEREALRAFACFTELTANTEDLETLSQRAAEVLQATLNVRSAVYFGHDEDGQWRAQYVSEAISPEAERQIRAGISPDAPSFAVPLQRREPTFFEPWDAGADGLSGAGGYGAVARYPIFPQDQPPGMLGMATTAPAWTEREKAVFRAVGDSFRLALERAARLRQLERQRQRLSDLNAELGTFIRRVARTLEAPAGYLERLLEPSAGGADEEPPLDPAVLTDEVIRLRGVERDLRELSALECHELKLDFVPLHELFSEVQARLPGERRPQWLLGPLPIVRADRALLRQALEVLMTFTLSATRGAQFVTVESREVSGEVQVTVSDDGAGLSAEEASTLFDLTVRTAQSVPPLEGSGLVQVRRILARHGGWAWAEARLTGGKVVLAFPRAEETAALERLLSDDA